MRRRIAIASPGTGGAVSGGRIGLGPDSIGAALDALTTFPGRDRSHHGDATAEHRSAIATPRTAQLSTPPYRSRAGPPARHRRRGRDPVWLDLAATAGVGLTGPGAAAVTRTVLQLLLTYRTAGEGHRPPRHPRGTPGRRHRTRLPTAGPWPATAAPAPPVVGHPWVSVAARSFAILDAAHVEIDPPPQPTMPTSRTPTSAIAGARRHRRAPVVGCAVGDARSRTHLRTRPATPRRGPRRRTPLRHHRRPPRPLRHRNHPAHRPRPPRAPTTTPTTPATQAPAAASPALSCARPDPPSSARLLATGPARHRSPRRRPTRDQHPARRTDPSTELRDTPPPPARRDLAPASTTRTEPTASTAAPLTAATLTVFGETCLRYRSPSDIEPSRSTRQPRRHRQRQTPFTAIEAVLRGLRRPDHRRSGSAGDGAAAVPGCPPRRGQPRLPRRHPVARRCRRPTLRAVLQPARPASAAPCTPPPKATTSTSSSSVPATDTGSTSTWSPPTTPRSCTPPPTSTTPTRPSGRGRARPSSTPTAAPWAGITPAANGSSNSSSTPATATCAR